MPAQNPETAEALTYANYLRVDDLLALQRPRSTEHDEILYAARQTQGVREVSDALIVDF